MAVHEAVMLLLIISTSGIYSILAQSLPTAWMTGIATNYGGAADGMDPNSPSYGTLDGSCGYGLLNPNVYPYWTVAALSPSNQFAAAGPSGGCGQCFEIQCMNSAGQFAGRCSSSQSITVTITDSCPECEADHIDIQALTFNKIAPMAAGRIDIQYRRVDCTPPNPVSIDIDNNVGSGGWLRLVVEKTAGFGGITAVSIRGAGAAWSPMVNKFGSAWEVATTPSLPWDFQFTSDSGQSLVASNLVNQNGAIGSIPTGVQFSLSGSTGSSTINYDSAAPASSPPPAPGVSASGQSSGPPPNSAAGTLPSPASPPPAATGSSAAAAGSCPCADVPPSADLTCAQQEGYGKCEDSFITSGNFCQLTCGHCPASCPSGGSTAQSLAQNLAGNPPPSQGSSGPSPPTPVNAGTPPTPAGQAAGTPPTGIATSPPTALQAASPPPTPLSAATATGSVQTQSICSDKPPASGGSCPSLAAVQGACGTSLPQGVCDKSCYRPC